MLRQLSNSLNQMATSHGPRLAGHVRLLGKAAQPFSSSSGGLQVLTLPGGVQRDLSPGEITLSMPAEYAPHSGCWIAWPRRPDIWRSSGVPAKAAFTEVIKAINQFEPVTVVAHHDQYTEARKTVPSSIRVVQITIDDSWLRDTGPTFVYGEVKSCPQPPIRALIGMDWGFNGWGDLPGDYEQDKQVASKICELERLPYITLDMILEGGSIHSDGEGTLLTTEECLLHPNRNPAMSKWEIDAVLKRCLGVTKIIWLPKGLYGDEDTNGHVDNFACFARPGVVLLAWTDDVNDPQYAISKEALELLQQETDAAGRQLQVVKVPCPPPLYRTQEECDTLAEEGKTFRKVGERLAASYVNFYIANGGIVMPAFNEPETDARAQAVLQEVFPERQVVAVQTREIVLGGGNIHCITQQQPVMPRTVEGPLAEAGMEP